MGYTWKNCNVSARWLVARMHVTDSYETVAADLADRAGLNYIGHPDVARIRAAAATAGVIHHRRNRVKYAAMTW